MGKNKGLRRSLSSVLVLIFLLISAITAFSVCQYEYIRISDYNISSEKISNANSGFTILQISDMHSKVFAFSNKLLVRKIKRVDPDVIVASGDMLNSVNDNGEVFIELCKTLCRDYPVYYVAGNHELILKNVSNREIYDSYISALEEIGVNILFNKSEVINDDVVIHGAVVPLMYYRDAELEIIDKDKPFNLNRLRELVPAPYENDGYKDKLNVLVAHTPVYLDTYAQWGADLVLSGHMHGGAIYIPGVGGLLSPEKEFFPEYYRGLYTKGDTNMVVNAGFSSGTFKLRLFNYPEISVIRLFSDNTEGT